MPLPPAPWEKGGQTKSKPFKSGTNSAKAVGAARDIRKREMQLSKKGGWKKSDPLALAARKSELAGLAAGKKSTELRQIADQAGVDPKELVTQLRPKEDPGFGGFVSDLSGTIGSIPRATVALAKGVGREVASSAENIYENPLDPNSYLPVHQVEALGKGFAGTADQKTRERHPLFTGQGESFRNTWNRVSDPERFVEEFSEDPFSVLVEDAGNLALPGMAATKGFRLAGMTRTADAAATATKALDTIGQGPFLPVSGAARLANKGIGVLGEAAAKSDRIQRALAPLKLDRASRQTKVLLRSAQEQIGEVANRQAKLGRRLQRLVSDPIEQQAMYVVGEGQAQALSALRKAQPENFNRLVAEQFGESLSPKAAHLAADIVDGRAPELAARVDEALTLGREAPGGRLERQDQYLQGAPSRAAQGGFSPLPDVVGSRVSRLEGLLGKARAEAELTALRASAHQPKLKGLTTDAEFGRLSSVRETGQTPKFIRSDLNEQRLLGNVEQRQHVLDLAAGKAGRRVARLEGKLENARKGAEYSVAAAPARLRPALTINRDVQSLLTKQENQLRLDGLHDDAARIGALADEIPTTLARLEEAGINPDHFIHVQAGDRPHPGGGPRTALPRFKKARSEKVRKENVTFDRSVPAQARAELDELKEVIKRETAQKVAELPFAVRLGQGPLRGIATKAEAEAAGFSAWDPRSPFETPATVTPDTVFLPKQVKESFRSYFNDPGLERALNATYDKVTQAFKIIVLPLSPSWQVGNVVGNTFLAGLGAGVDPVRLSVNIVRAIRDYRKSGPKGMREFSGPDRLYQSGATFETLDFMNPKVQARGRLRSAISAPARAGYAFNQFVDNVGRTAVYMAKKEGGRSSELALKEALRAMGDYSNMSLFEKRFVRRVIPFYAWQKHITKLAFTLPIEHPMRTAWTLKLADQYGQGEEWMEALPDWLQSAVPLGGGNMLLTSSLFPFPVNPLESITNPGRSLAPQLKLLAANYGPWKGIDPNNGQPYSRPPGTGDLDDYGRDRPTPPSILQQLRSIPPQLRVLDALSGRDDVARYDSGDVVTVKGEDGKRVPIPSGRSSDSTLLRFLGVPMDREDRLVDIALTAESGRAKSRKAREGQKPKSGGGGGSLPKAPWEK